MRERIQKIYREMRGKKNTRIPSARHCCSGSSKLFFASFLRFVALIVAGGDGLTKIKIGVRSSLSISREKKVGELAATVLPSD